MLETLINLDKSMYHFINGTLHNVAFDFVFSAVRERLVWVPLYLFGAFFFVNNYKRDGWLILVVLGLMVAVSDQSTSSVFKPLIGRIRPCNTPSMYTILPTSVKCGAGFSMPSSHAANHFAVAVFVGLIFYRKHKQVLPILIFWAAIICFAQVYVGVHYPFDVIIGGLWGSILGYVAYRICNHYLSDNFYAPPLPAPPLRRKRSHVGVFENFKNTNP